MNDDVNELLATNEPSTVELVNGRYRIPHPETGRPTLWTRATTLAKTLDDPYHLEQWKLRRAIIGVAHNPSLAAAVIAAEHDSTIGGRTDLNRLAKEAMDKAGAAEGRDLGTALHRILERVDRGDLDPAQVPAPWRSQVDAWAEKQQRTGLTVDPAYIEVCVVNPTLGAAGRVDLLLRDREGMLVVADRKTGSYVSPVAWAAQMAVYATATHTWDGQHLQPMPTVRQDYALIVHQPAGTDQCHIHRLDIGAGYEACLQALEVRRLRRTRPNQIMSLYDVPGDLEPVLEASTEAAFEDRYRAWLIEKLGNLRDRHPDAFADVAKQWPDDVPTFKQADHHTTEQLDTITRIVERVEAAHQIPFGDPRPVNHQPATQQKANKR